MRSFLFALIVTIVCTSCNAFAPGPSVNGKSSQVSTEVMDVAVIAGDPELMKGLLQTGGDQLYALVGGAAAVVAAGFATVKGKIGESTTTEEEPEPIDVSIPYNAAARLAFSSAKLSEDKFEAFNTLYLAKTVAGVTAKKMARDVLEMEKVADNIAKEMEAL